MSEPRSDVRTTDRGMWLVVARRDFWVRLRDRGFVISTAITLVVLSIFIVLRAYTGDDAPSFRLGVVESGGTAVADAADLEAAGERRGVEVTTVPFDDAAAAEQALRDGEIDAALVHGDDLEGRTSVPPQLAQIVQDAMVRARIQAALADAQVPASTIDEVLNQPAIQVRTLEPVDPNRDANAGIAFIGVLLAYGQLFGYGVWVATGVIEEKSSRVVEVLLSAIRPRQLLAGKIAGIGALGICQLAFIAAFAIGLAMSPARSTCPPPRSHRAHRPHLVRDGVRVLRGAVRRFGLARLAHGGAAERDGAAQPVDLRVVLHLDRRAGEPRFHAGDRGLRSFPSPRRWRCRCASCWARPRRRRSWPRSRRC